MKNAYKCKPGYRQTKQTWGGGGAYDKVKEDKYYRGTTGAEKEPNKKNKQHRTVKAGTIRE